MNMMVLYIKMVYYPLVPRFANEPAYLELSREKYSSQTYCHDLFLHHQFLIYQAQLTLSRDKAVPDKTMDEPGLCQEYSSSVPHELMRFICQAESILSYLTWT